MHQSGSLEYVLHGAIPTAPEPPCFAYPVFKTADKSKARYLQILQRGVIVGFQPIVGAKVVRLKRNDIVQVGDAGLLCIKAQRAKYFVGRQLEMQKYVRKIISSKIADKCPVFKRSLQDFVGDGRKREETNSEIIKLYEKRRPESIHYFILNDILRTYVAHQLRADAKETFSLTRILRENGTIQLEYPDGTTITEKKTIDSAVSSTLQRSEQLKRFVSQPEPVPSFDRVPEEVSEPFYKGEFDFPFKPSFIESIRNLPCFYVPAAYEYIYENQLKVPSKLYGIGIGRSTLGERIYPLKLKAARRLAKLRGARQRQLNLFGREKPDRIFVSIFSLDSAVIKLLRGDRPATREQFNSLKYAVTHSLPIGAIFEILRLCFSRTDQRRSYELIKIGAKSPPVQVSRGFLKMHLTWKGINDGQAIRTLKSILDV